MRQKYFSSIISTGRNSFAVTDRKLLESILRYSRPIPKDHRYARTTFVADDGEERHVEIPIPSDSEMHAVRIGIFPVLIELERKFGKPCKASCFLIHPEALDVLQIPSDLIADAVKRRQISALPNAH